MDTQPGQVITPHDEKAQQSDSAQSKVSSGTDTPLQMPTPKVSPGPEEKVTQNSADSSSVPQSEWQQSAQVNTQIPSPFPADDIEWTAAEFIEHPKTISWYVSLVLASVVLAAADYLLTKDIISTVVILIAATMFGVYAGRKPHTRQYHLGPQGLQIGEKTYGYQSYKHFSVIDEGTVSSIVFMPMKRFEVPLTIYVSTEIEEQVLDYLSIFLPMERHRVDAVDGLLRRIRF